MLGCCAWVFKVATLVLLMHGNLCGTGMCRFHLPSPHARMQLLPLVEMYCTWELEEDCTNLEALMVRFDYVAELESHELGCLLLFMVRHDEDGLHMYSQCDAPPNPIANPFDAVKERLAASDLAF